jgi:hypothetical protein
MYIGFVVHRVARKAFETAAAVVCVGLCTTAGRKAARAVWASAKGAVCAAYQEATHEHST